MPSNRLRKPNPRAEASAARAGKHAAQLIAATMAPIVTVLPARRVLWLAMAEDCPCSYWCREISRRRRPNVSFPPKAAIRSLNPRRKSLVAKAAPDAQRLHRFRHVVDAEELSALLRRLQGKSDASA